MTGEGDDVPGWCWRLLPLALLAALLSIWLGKNGRDVRDDVAIRSLRGEWQIVKHLTGKSL